MHVDSYFIVPQQCIESTLISNNRVVKLIHLHNGLLCRNDFFRSIKKLIVQCYMGGKQAAKLNVHYASMYMKENRLENNVPHS